MKIFATQVCAALAAFILTLPAVAQSCLGDIAIDNRIDGGDLGVMLANWGPVTSTALSRACDLDGNAIVNGADLGILLNSWGGCPAVITAIVPNMGAQAGGTAVIIAGNFLGDTSSVKFGGVAATTFVVVSESQISAVTPPGSPGSVDVEICKSHGKSTVRNGFSYVDISVPAWATLVESLPDPSVVTDPSLRAAIAATGLAWRVRDRASQIEMLLVPPGIFQMGCTAAPYPGTCLSAELPLHQVTLTNPFYLGKFEVTQAQWTATVGQNTSHFRDYPDSADRPVERVGWSPIQSFLGSTGLRLPTEAEWEFACRAGTQGPLYNNSMDDRSLAALAWYASNSLDRTHPVGQKAPNPLGFYDMLGNVWEIVDDWFDSYPSTNQTNPTGPVSGDYHVGRGGSWETASYNIRSSFRFGTSESLDMRQGFRVARNP